MYQGSARTTSNASNSSPARTNGLMRRSGAAEAAVSTRTVSVSWALMRPPSIEADRGAGLDESWAGELLSELNRFCNAWDAEHRETWPQAAAILAPLLARRNGSRTHELAAIGHAHLDTAWLWPLAETWRKAQRTFTTQLGLMRDYPEHRFACSSAQHYAWVKERDPELYGQMLARVREGQWVPVGGTWIEPDCNLPSGESLVRQFLYGQRFFEAELGGRAREFWNPDVFGYNGQLPQIVRGAGMTRFLTQKLSWNRFTSLPFHTFAWEGLDGSRITTHFPPADTYNAQVGAIQRRSSAIVTGQIGCPDFFANNTAPSFATRGGPLGPSIVKAVVQPLRIKRTISTTAPTPPRVDEPRTAP